MGVSNGLETRDLPVSEMAENLVGSEIIRLAGNIRKKVAAGAQIHNLTIGDFNPKIFPIPAALKAEIIAAYQADATITQRPTVCPSCARPSQTTSPANKACTTPLRNFWWPAVPDR